MRKWRFNRPCWILGLVLLLSASSLVGAQSDNSECDNPEGPSHQQHVSGPTASPSSSPPSPPPSPGPANTNGGRVATTQLALARELAAQQHREPATVQCELLRLAPTQVGVACPKYYCWVRILERQGGIKEEGVARFAEVDPGRFELLQYLTKEEIRAHPDRLPQVFSGGPVR